MNTVNHAADKIEFVYHLSPIARIIFLLFSLIPLLAPYELLIKPSWDGKISIVLLFFIVISIGAVLVSFFFVSAALFGRSQFFEFDPSRRVVIYRFKTAFFSLREERYDFSKIEALQIKVNEWDSKADTYDISVKIQDRPEMNFGDFSSRQDAEYYLAIVEEMRSK